MMAALRPYVPGLAFLGLLLAVFSVWPPKDGRTQEGQETPLVQDVRVGQNDQTTRIVLEFAPDVLNPPTYRWFTLPDPARVVVDFGEVRFATPLNDVALPEVSMAKGMRAGFFRAGTTRMVMDLKKPSRVNVFSLPVGVRGHRVVIDVSTVKPGQKATDIPPPLDVVDTMVKPRTVEAVVVPPQVVQDTPKNKHEVVVTLDAGHGGVDPGGCGKGGLCEKNFVLEVAKLVREKLRKEGIRVVMTRDNDIFIPLGERVKVGQRANSDLFVSLHADIHPTRRDVDGATVYMVSEKASDREAQRLADSENAGDILAGVALEGESKEVQNILISLVQRETINGSSYLAQSILSRMDDVAVVRKKTPLFAGFKVLKAPDVPSVLVELGYLSNPREEKLMRTRAYREQLATAVSKGIIDYVKQHVHR